MRAIKSKNTKPELTVRRWLHAAGYRFRLHRRDLPGRPDIVLPKHKAAIFVHGCFWHQHDDPSCRNARKPTSNTKYWEPKFARNKARDDGATADLAALGWRVLTIWECALRDGDRFKEQVRVFLK
jgi:DNA mismatch endonuclease (patch repair protein)